MSEFETVTRSEFRKDAWGKVTGQARYTDDISLSGLLHGGVLRSPHHYARILKIDIRPALQIEGVVAVLTAKDIPAEKTFGAILQDRPVLAFDMVRHIGEPVALVLAESRHAVGQALRAIEIQYETLPYILDVTKASAPDAPLVHPGGNILSEYEIGQGDIEMGFSSADIVLEETFFLPRIYPAYLEPETAAAEWQDDETILVWVSSQKPFEDRYAISKVLGIPEDRIHVRGATIGGAFGGKEDSGLPILAALGAWSTRRAVRLVNTREESIQAHPKRHAGVIRCKLGAHKDGTLVALSVDACLDTGAYASYGPAVGGTLTEIAAGPYRTPNVRVATKVVYTNGPLSGAMRGFGAPQAAFALESMMDMMSAELDIDPVEFRRKNAWRKGDHTPTGVLLIQEPSLNACLDEVEKAMAEMRSIQPSPGKLGGVGFALLVQAMGLGYGVPDDVSTRIEWLPNGHARLDIGTPDLGQGTITVGAQIAAEALGLRFDEVDVADLDTSLSPNGGVSCASRMLYMVGNASLLAAEKAIQVLLEEAARKLGQPRDKLAYEAGQVFIGSKDAQGIPASEFSSRAAEEGRVLAGEGKYSFPYPIEITPQNLPTGMPHVMFGFGAHVARVEVDPDFGTVAVREIVAIHDVGRAINPVGLEGQIEGGVTMGVGYALQEEVKLKEDGRWTDSFTEYLLPTTLDAPKITPVILEYREPSGPFGARGVAEMSLTPVAPAIANAVADATNRRITSLPIKPELLITNK
jgi:CO/xanthine dehydrogenase Mo-binding subunit